MVLHLSDFGPSCYEVRDLPAPSSDKNGYISMKKHLHPRTEEDDDQEDMERSRQKKAKKNNSETEADSSSCFVALVTASNLHKDALYLPKDFSSSNGFKRECCKIVLTDGVERSWVLDLRFNESSDSFYISRGWRSFCDENRKEAGAFFVFKLVGKGEMPLLSFCPTESKGEKASSGKTISKEEIKKNNLSFRDSTPPSLNRFVTLTVTQNSLTRGFQYLPLSFIRENGLEKPGVITLLGKDGTKWLANIRQEGPKQTCLGKGWKEFAIANGLKIGESFTLESIWENGTQFPSLLNTVSTSDTRQQGEYCSEDGEKEPLPVEPSSGKKISKEVIKKNYLRLSQNRFVILTVTHDSLQNGRQNVPLAFMRGSGMDKPGMITLLGRDGTKWLVNLRQGCTKKMYLGKGWKEFAIANGLKMDESFTLESISENGTPMLPLFNTYSTHSRRQQVEYCSKTSEKESLPIDPSSGKNTSKEEIKKNNMFSFCPTESRGEKARDKHSLLVEPSSGKKISIESTSDARQQGEYCSKASENMLYAGYNSEIEADSSSSSDHSSFVALVTASNLHEDALYLPKDFSSSNGLQRECREIVLTDGGERAWFLDLRFNKSSETFYISRGWRSFCDENHKEAGAFFVFKLVGKGEMPLLLSFCPTERRGEKASEKESLPIEPSSGKNTSTKEIKKNNLGCSDSTPPSQNRFVTLTVTKNSLTKPSQYLPLSFTRENGLDKPGVITLLGKDGTKWLVNLRREQSKQMCLGKGWREFAIANGLKTGESFTLESIWKDTTPTLSLLNTVSTNGTRQQGEYCSRASEKESLPVELSSGEKISKDDTKKNYLRLSQNRFVILTVTHDSLRKGRQNVPVAFMRQSGMGKPGIITLLGRDGTKWPVYLRQVCTKQMNFGKGWKEFALANGLKTGESFTLESVWENKTPMLRLFNTVSTSDTRQQGEYCSKASEKELVPIEPNSGNNIRKAKNSIEEMIESSSAIQNRFVTLTLTREDVRDCQLILPSQFMKANGINKLGKINFLGKNKTKWFAYLLSKDGMVALGYGWKEFCEANDVKTGESFTLEFLYEQDTTPVFEFCPIFSTY